MVRIWTHFAQCITIGGFVMMIIITDVSTVRCLSGYGTIRPEKKRKKNAKYNNTQRIKLRHLLIQGSVSIVTKKCKRFFVVVLYKNGRVHEPKSAL